MTENAMLVAIEEAFEEARNLDAPLNDRLAVVAARVQALSADFAAAVERLIARLQGAGAGAAAPQVGDRMPGFALPDETGRIVTLRSVIADGPAAISFNRGHWCPYCRLNVGAMAEVQAEIAALGGQLVAIVPERRKFAAALKASAQAPFAVLTDMDNGYALALNLAIWVGAEMAALIAEAGWDVPAYQGNSAWLLPIPATFVVRPDGIIAARHMEPDYRRRMDIDVLINAVKLARAVRNPAIPLHAAG
jgi:peroxiredoxin